MGHRAGHRDRDVSHPHAVSGHGAAPPDVGAGPHHDRTTGTSTTRATPCSGRRGCRPRALESGYRWAYREFYRWRSIARGASAHDDAGARPAARGLRGRLEEVRAAVGLRDPRERAGADAAGARERSSASSAGDPMPIGAMRAIPLRGRGRRRHASPRWPQSAWRKPAVRRGATSSCR